MAKFDEPTFEILLDGKRIIAFTETSGWDLQPGDMYIARRNTGWQLAKCKRVVKEDGYVMPDPPCSIYHYDCYECYKVAQILEREALS